MREDRRLVRPVHPGARLNMPLEIVGVQLHQPRREVIAAAIHRATGHTRARPDTGDPPVAQNHRSAPDLSGQHNEGIGENRLFCHVTLTFSCNTATQR